MEIDKICLGDAFEFIKQVPDGSIDLILTSPPYGIGKEYERRLLVSIIQVIPKRL
jgi:adenine-specific DNA-methyltransferase